MTPVINPGQMLKIKVSINLCGGNVGMAEQLLYRAQVAAGFQHVAGEGVSKQVRV